MPRNWRTPVMSHDDKFLVAKGRRQPGDIVAQLDDIVGFDRLRPVASAVSALVGYCDLKPRLDDRVYLMAPEVPALRKPMQQHDQRSFTFNHRAQGHPVGLDHFEVSLLHAFFLLLFLAAMYR